MKIFYVCLSGEPVSVDNHELQTTPQMRLCFEGLVRHEMDFLPIAFRSLGLW
ncbi:hypothetical protein D9M70_183990 [compost metagenome]